MTTANAARPRHNTGRGATAGPGGWGPGAAAALIFPSTATGGHHSPTITVWGHHRATVTTGPVGGRWTADPNPDSGSSLPHAAAVFSPGEHHPDHLPAASQEA